MLKCKQVWAHKGADIHSGEHVVPAELSNMQVPDQLTFDSSSSAAVQLIFVLRVYVSGTSLLGRMWTNTKTGLDCTHGLPVCICRQHKVS